jgi:hypothetical protein
MLSSWHSPERGYALQEMGATSDRVDPQSLGKSRKQRRTVRQMRADLAALGYNGSCSLRAHQRAAAVMNLVHSAEISGHDPCTQSDRRTAGASLGALMLTEPAGRRQDDFVGCLPNGWLLQTLNKTRNARVRAGTRRRLGIAA